MMAERKTKVTLGDRTLDGFEVPVDSSNEKWSEFKLEDGTLIRAKVNMVSAIRVDGEYDPAGNPLYALNMAPAIAIIETPEHLRKKES
jgi:hypothetical protein